METEHPLTIWRKSRDLLTADVAKMIPCTRAAVGRYEAGRTPRQPIMDRIVILTEGAVTANDWLGKEAADVVASRQARA